MRFRKIIMIKQMVDAANEEVKTELRVESNVCRNKERLLVPEFGSHDRWRNALPMRETYRPPLMVFTE